MRMKKIYLFIFIALFSINTSKAATIVVTVNNFSFSPATFSCLVGDSVRWVLGAGTHTTTSQLVPSGAATWNSPIDGTTTKFGYKVTVAGTYAYMCTIHGVNMSAGFQASGTGIQQIDLNAATVVYPNPCKDKFTITYGNIDAVTIFGLTGKEIKTMKLSPFDAKAEIDMSTLSAGIYFYRTSKEGTVVETKRIIKSN